MAVAVPVDNHVRDVATRPVTSATRRPCRLGPSRTVPSRTAPHRAARGRAGPNRAEPGWAEELVTAANGYIVATPREEKCRTAKNAVVVTRT
jgi:hypothetical protein